MCAASRKRTLRRMSTTKAARITLDLLAGADPIRGSIEHADGRRQPFWGWLELIEALERAAADQPAERRKTKPSGEEQ